MMEFFSDIVAYEFMVYALVACLLSGVTCGIVGSYIVARRMVFLCGGITHASFGGLGIALYAGLNPLIGALSFASLSSLGIEFASRSGRMREDSAVGIIWSVGMAIGALFMSLRPGYASDLTSYLFGNILLISRSDILWLGVLTLLLVVGAMLWLRPIMYMTFDEAYARSQGIRTTLVSYIMAVVVAVTIVMSIKVMGIILLLSLVTMPTVIASTFKKSYGSITIIAVAVATFANFAGFMLSYRYDMMTGVCIIFILVAMLVVAKLLTIFRYSRLNR